MAAPILDAAQYMDKPNVLQVSYNKKDLLIYAVGIGCDEERFTYEQNKDFEIFPTFPVSLFFKGDSNDAHEMKTNPVVKATFLPFAPRVFSLNQVVDGERYIECVRPMPLEGGSFVFRAEHTAVLKKGPGSLVSEVKVTIEDQNGGVYYRFWGSFYARGKKMIDFKDAGTSGAVAIEIPDRAPDATEQCQTSPLQALMYRLAGDMNNLHVDKELCKSLGYEKPILQGLGTLGIASRAVLKVFGGNEAKSFHSIRVRFAKPVYPGQTLETQMWKVDGAALPDIGPGKRRVFFRTKCVETGDTVISNAFMDLHGAEDPVPSAKI